MTGETEFMRASGMVGSHNRPAMLFDWLLTHIADRDENEYVTDARGLKARRLRLDSLESA